MSRRISRNSNYCPQMLNPFRSNLPQHRIVPSNILGSVRTQEVVNCETILNSHYAFERESHQTVLEKMRRAVEFDAQPLPQVLINTSRTEVETPRCRQKYEHQHKQKYQQEFVEPARVQVNSEPKPIITNGDTYDNSAAIANQNIFLQSIGYMNWFELINTDQNRSQF